MIYANPTDTVELREVIASKYIRRIKNMGKPEYAKSYWNFLKGEQNELPSYTCSFMAAQAVRMELRRVCTPEMLKRVYGENDENNTN